MEIEWTQILIQMVNFGLIVVVLTKLVYKPIVKILSQRTDRIASSQLDADKTRQQNQTTSQAAQAELLKAKQTAEQIIREAQKEARADAAKILAEAKIQAKKQTETERQQSQAEMKAEKKSVLGKLATLVTQTTAQVLQNALSSKEQHQIIASQLKIIKGVRFD